MDEDDDAWRVAGSRLAAHVLDQAHYDIDSAFVAASGSLRGEHALSATDVRAIRRALNEARWLLEE